MDVFEANSSTLGGLWVSASPTTMVAMEKAWDKYFAFQCLGFEEAVARMALQQVELATPIVFECKDEGDSSEQLSRFGEEIKTILASTHLPVVICLGNNLPAQKVVDWIKRGVFTYLEKQSQVGVFEQSMGEAYERASELRRQFHRFENLIERWNSVSDREAIVLDMLLDGIPNKTIANRLGVSQRTIETRRHNLYEKLDSRCIAELVRTIYELDLLDKTFRRIDNDHSLRVDALRQRSRCERPLPKLHREDALSSE